MLTQIIKVTKNKKIRSFSQNYNNLKKNCRIKLYVIKLEIDCRVALRRNKAQLTLQDTDDAKNGRRIDYFTVILLNYPPLMLILNKPGQEKRERSTSPLTLFS